MSASTAGVRPPKVPVDGWMTLGTMGQKGTAWVLSFRVLKEAPETLPWGL